MKRRNFLRDITLGIAASLLPKILQPMDVEGKCAFDEKKINERLEFLRNIRLLKINALNLDKITNLA